MPHRLSRLAGLLALCVVASLAGGCVAPPVAPTPAPSAAAPAPAAGSAAMGEAAGGAVTVAIAADPEALDPILVASTNSSLVSRLIFDPLVETNPRTGATEPRLATEWRQEEPSSWLFTIRAGARFHNGDPVAADDVAFSYTRAIADPKSRLATSKAIIREAVALDDRTVRIVTRQPYPSFLDQLGRMGITPRRAVETLGDERFNREPVGAGPLRLVEWARDDHVTLARNADYWRTPRPVAPGRPLARVTLRPIPSAATRLAELRTGGVDLAVSVPPEEAEPFRAQGMSVQTVPTRRTMYLGLNTGSGTAGEIAEEPLRDPRVRQAIGYAIDVPALIHDVLEGAGNPVGGTLVPQNFGFDPELAPIPHDPVRARALLAEAGYRDGFTLDFDVPNGRYPRDKEIGEAIAGQLAAVGIRTRLIVAEWSAFAAKYQGQKLRGLYLLGIGKEYQPDAHLITYYSSRGRGWYFRDDEVDRLVERITSSFDPAARAADLHALERRLREIGQGVYLYQQIETYVHQPRLHWAATADDYLWLDEATVD